MFLGMENTVESAEGTAEKALAIQDPPTLVSPEKGVGAQSDTSENTQIVPSFQMQVSSDEQPTTLPEHLRQIPFHLELRVPLSRFTLRDLQGLTVGALLVTEHLSVRDLVLNAAGERLLLVELEAIEQQLAARIKRLAWRHRWRRKA